MKTSTLDPSEIKAIPTVYNGVQLRSRMEGKCCLLFDKLGWKWEYEPFSINMDGLDYMPDFYIQNRGYVVECRGYESEKGAAQLSAFSSRVRANNVNIPGRKICGYIVLGPDCARAYSPSACGPCCAPQIVLCPVCEQWHQDFGANLCQECGYDRARDFLTLSVEVREGQILVDGEKPPEWGELPWSMEEAWYRWVDTRIEKAFSILSLAGFDYDAHWLRALPIIRNTSFSKFGVSRGDVSGDRLDVLNAALRLSDIAPKYFWVEG